MPTNTYYKNLFTKPLVLNEKQSDDFVKAVKTSYLQERRKTIDKVVQDILLKTGRPSISKKDKDLVWICYHTASHSFHGRPSEKTLAEMWQCLSGRLRDSELFHKVVIHRKATYYLNTEAFPCKERKKGYCGLNREFCKLCYPMECGYFIIKTQKSRKFSPNELAAAVNIGYTATNSDWMDSLMKQNKR